MEFLIGVLIWLWGVCTPITFLYYVALGVDTWGNYAKAVREMDTYRQMELFVRGLGWWRLALYISLSVLWPAVMFYIVFSAAYWQMRQEGRLTPQAEDRLDWVLLGFGRFYPKK
jgi:hypothetical protein